MRVGLPPSTCGPKLQYAVLRMWGCVGEMR